MSNPSTACVCYTNHINHKQLLSVCLSACVRACVRACVHACVRVQNCICARRLEILEEKECLNVFFLNSLLPRFSKRFYGLYVGLVEWI